MKTVCERANRLTRTVEKDGRCAVPKEVAARCGSSTADRAAPDMMVPVTLGV